MNNLSFNLQELITIPSYEDKFFYCKNNLNKFLGEGIARKVWELDDNTIIKVAKNEMGIIQNQAEIEIYNKYNHYDILRKIIDYDKINYHYLICEKCDILSLKSFKELTDMTFSEFHKLIIGLENIYSNKSTIKKKLTENEFNLIKNKFPNITKFVLDLKPPKPSEMTHICNLGVKNNNIILMDYGYNEKAMELDKINNKHRHFKK